MPILICMVVPHEQTYADDIFSVWRMCRGLFCVLPPGVCTHPDWDILDANMAACVTCGQTHICKEDAGHCETAYNDEGFPVCIVTGCITRTLSHCSAEYIDTVFLDKHDDKSQPLRSRPRLANHPRQRGTCGHPLPHSKKDSIGYPSHSKKDSVEYPPHSNRSGVENTPHSRKDGIGLPPVAEYPGRGVSLPLDSRYAVTAVMATKVNKKNRYRSVIYNRIQMCRSHRKPFVSMSTGGNDTRIVNRYPHLCPMDTDELSEMRELVSLYVTEVICSQKWADSIDAEIAKLLGRWHSTMYKYLKEFKCSARYTRGELPNVIDMICHAQHTTLNCRRPLKLSHHDRLGISEWCTECIHRHIMLLNSACDQIITVQKLRPTVVGLLYLMRNGIVIHDVVVLKKLPVLTHILPMEIHLLQFFGVQNKCITQTENIAKEVLKSLSADMLTTFLQ